MESAQTVIPLAPLSEEASKISWKGKLFSPEAALVLPGRARTLEHIQIVTSNTLLVLKFVPLKDAFRSKLLGALGGSTSTPTAEIWGLTAKLNPQTATLEKILELRKATATATEDGRFMANTDQTVIETLSQEEESALVAVLSKHIKDHLAGMIQEPFAAFSSESYSAWKTKPLQEMRPERLLPYNALFPFALPIERELDGAAFFLDDMYCTKPACPCTDVTCLILKIEPDSGKEVAWGGFRYDVNTGKLKVMQDLPSKFNAQEWFKQFSLAYPFDLTLTLESRYRFVRNDFLKARDEALTARS
jgi:hypothetical protein